MVNPFFIHYALERVENCSNLTRGNSFYPRSEAALCAHVLYEYPSEEALLL